MDDTPRGRQHSTVLEPPPPASGSSQRRITRRVVIGVSATLLLFLTPLVALGNMRHSPLVRGVAQPTPTTPYSVRWTGDVATRQPDARNAVFAGKHEPVDGQFQAFYTAHDGAQQLGAPLTPGFASSLGWTQFYTNGALVLPSPSASAAAQQDTPTGAADFSPALLRDGVHYGGTAVVRLSLLQALLSAGSEVPLGGAGSTLTYASLRAATLPARLITLPAPRASKQVQPTSTVIARANGVFVSEARDGSKLIGHTVPQAIWTYITGPAAPDGWKVDFGQPLTEALAGTLPGNGAQTPIEAQAFQHGVVVLEGGTQPDAAQPAIQLASIGLDYLLTFGPPHIAAPANTPAWVTASNVALMATAGGNSASVHVGQNFPVQLAGAASWENGALWYEVRWTGVKLSGVGWIPSDELTFANPGDGVDSSASFDTLSPDLMAYLASRGANTGVAVYDVTRHRYYTYNADNAYTAASSMKVPIMLTMLATVEAQGRGPNDDEQENLTAMIENSDNDAAQALYEEEGGPDAISGLLSSLNISGYTPNDDAWGWSTLTPMTMVHMLTDLQEGKVLNSSDRAYALNLMENIESDQQNGVGDSAPQGATVAMKDGWVPGPDGLWAVNSSGIVTVGNETYIISVYSQELNSEDDGWDIARHICGAVAQALT